MLWHHELDAQVLFRIIGGQLHQVLELIMRSHDVVSGTAVQAGAVCTVEIGGAIEVRAVLHLRDTGTHRQSERCQGHSCQHAGQGAKRKWNRRSAHDASHVLCRRSGRVVGHGNRRPSFVLGRKADRFMNEGYSPLSWLPMENGQQSISGDGQGMGGMELLCR